MISNLTLSKPTLFGSVETPVLARGAFVPASGLGYEAIDLQEHGQQIQRAYLLFLATRLYLLPTAETKTALPSGKTWVSVALTGRNAGKEQFPGFVEQAEGLTPQLLLDEILWGVESASAKGEPVINHVPLAKYEVSVSLTRALAGASGPSAAAMRVAITEELAGLRASRPGIKSASVPITIWVDGPGRVVRIEATLPGSGLGAFSLAMSGFGTVVPKTVPAPSQIVDIGDLNASGSPWTFFGGT